MFCLNQFRFQHTVSRIVGAVAAMVYVSCDGASVPISGFDQAPVEELEGFERGKVSISGRVILSGTPANPDTTVKVGGDAFCKSHGDISTERWKISASGGLQDAVVFVLDAPATPLSSDKPLIRQQDCVYLPHVSAMALGQSATIQNDDLTFHNVRIVQHQLGSKNKGPSIANYGQPSKGSRHVHRFGQSGVYRLECDVHRWMRSWIYVHTNNHIAVTNENGEFEIPYGLRDGEYTVAVWHSQFPETLNAKVDVADGKAALDFTLTASQAFN